MTDSARLKREICEAIDRRADDIIRLGETIRRHPELGFKEFKTARLVEETLKALGLSPKTGLAITGVRAEARGSADGPTFALLGELDGLVVAGHPVADPETGAAHACGHNAQVAGLLGAAMGLLDAKAFAHLAGRVVFFAVPAEEYGDVEWRVAAGPRGAARVPGGQAGADAAGPLRRRGSGHDDPHHAPAGDAEGRRLRLEQRLHREDRPLHRPRRARGRRAPHGNQRALRRQHRAGRHQRGPRDLPRRGFHPRAPHHHPRRQPGERDPGRGPHRDLRAGKDGGGHPRRQRARGPRPPGGRARAGRHRGDRDAPGLSATVQPRGHDRALRGQCPGACWARTR